MKYVFPALLLMCLRLNAFAQNKADDALLLDYYQNQRFAEAADYLKSVYAEPITDPAEMAALDRMRKREKRK